MAYIQPPSEPIAIVGSGCRYPGAANTPSKLWELLKNPVDLSRKAPVSRYNVDGFYHENGEYHGTTNAPKAYFFDEDPRLFDASFFNITPKECEAIDPQGKVLLEVVYEAMESGGFTVQECSGKKIGVFVGTMTADYDSLCAKDEVTASQYSATGTSRAIISNRVSYFFNWNGPSMTIDTACSSSLVAMHQAVLSLRSGESNLACVAGANIMLAPEAFIIEASLHMLSPDGKSKMWDQSANGYARGEGVGVFFLKTLSKALADGDQIEAIVRETGVNSDGRTKGITMPSPLAQAELIKDTYNRSGLDPRNPLHRCQYFEAHGTGTQAGDPREAEAIYTAFFGPLPDPSSDVATSSDQLIVGSIKTIIGHTEGAAGVAGVQKAILGLKNRLIPPNQHLVTINPSVAPFTTHLKVPTELTPWPQAAPGQPLRASVNSFGFGGTNAHAILERYEPEIHGYSPKPTQQERLSSEKSSLGLPFLLSANTDKALLKRTQDFLEYLKTNQEINMQDLAWTLAHHRSNLAHKIAFPASDLTALIKSVENKLGLFQGGQGSELGVRTKDKAGQRRILGIFTGQGAQWASMGRELLETSPLFRKSLQSMNKVLKSCPDPPSWSLIDELIAAPKESRLNQAALSQPLCTAIQVALVDLLRASGVQFNAVIGHSSGEIGAAYASGAVDAREAILLAYYRGFHAKLAGSADGSQGGMMAAGMGIEEAIDFCNQDGLKSRLYVAASNAPASVTLSGDLDAVEDGKAKMDTAKKFVRLLKVDTAYHSHHMDRCATPYLDSLAACGIRGRLPRESCPWVSSVYGPAGSPTAKELSGRYWRDNMVQPVLFSEALTRVLKEHGPFDVALEVGPHPALKGPATQTMQDAIGKIIPYSGVLNRSNSDLAAFSDALGTLWCTLGATAVDFFGYSAALGVPSSSHIVVKNLPSYPWDHSVMHYREPRVMRQYVQRPSPPHELLGVRTLDDSESGLRWRNILQPNMLPWLNDHRFQGQIIVPAAAYCVMALDAARALAGNKSVTRFEIHNLIIRNGITMPDDSQGVETIFSLQRDSREDTSSSIVAQFILDWNPVDGSRSAKHAVSGTVVVFFGPSTEHALPRRPSEHSGLTRVDIDEFYDAVKDIGLGYTRPFRSLHSLHRRLNFATAKLDKPHPEETSALPVSPALLDSSFQTAFAAFSAPGDGALWTSFLPQRIDRLCFNPALCDAVPNETRVVDVDASITQFNRTTPQSQANFSVDIEIFNVDGCVEIQVEGLTVASFANTTPDDDRDLYLHTVYKVDPWSGLHGPLSDDQVAVDGHLAELCEKVSQMYLLPPAQQPAKASSLEDINNLIAVSPYRGYLDLIKVFGGSIPTLVPGLIQEILHDSLEVSELHHHLTHIVNQISHRFPTISVLEIDMGGGRISLAESIWSGLAAAASSYTYAHGVDASIPSITPTTGSLQPHKLKVVSFANEKPLFEQEFANRTYDLVIVAHALNQEALAEVRALVRPGGFLVVVQMSGRSLREKLLHALTQTPEEQPLYHTPPFQDAGFSEPIYKYATLRAGMSLAVTQAINDEVEFLRSPLYNIDFAGIQGKVMIVGGKRQETESIQRRINALLVSCGCQIILVRNFEDIVREDLQDLRAAIILADLDEPILHTMTATKLAGLKTLFGPNRYILWLTNGFRGDQPYHTGTFGMIRTIKGETPNMKVQLLDLDTLEGVEDITAAALLRFAYTSMRDTTDTLWTTESELVLDHGRILIPRLLPVRDANDRLNSSRRVIEKSLVIEGSAVELRPCHEAGQMIYGVTSIGHPSELGHGNDHVLVRMLCTSAWAVPFDHETYLFVGVGFTPAGRRVIVTSPTNASWVSVPKYQLNDVKLNMEDADLVTLLTKSIISQHLAKIEPRSMVIHEADRTFMSLLNASRYLTSQDEPIYYTTENQEKARGDDRFIFIHPRSRHRRLREMLPTRVNTLVDLTSNTSPTTAIKLAHDNLLNPSESLVHLSSHTGSLDNERDVLMTVIHLAQDRIAKAELDLDESPSAHSIHKVVGNGKLPYFAVIDWVNEAKRPLTQRVQPVDAATVLSPSKTYLLVGLTGDLGQSLCRYMVQNGARYIVVASRNPDKARSWALEIEQMGATIHLVSLDVSSLVSVSRIKEELAAALPPIGGVVNGAMLLADGLFADMTTESFQMVLQPKVAGSYNLDLAFHEPGIDFFIMFSSLTAIGGNSGQSNYTAANLYMAGLAAQRRKRGLPASVLDIGMLVGIGYINRVEGAEIYKNLRRQGYRPISEHDIHHMFVEAVLAGRVGSDSSTTQLSTGLQRFNPQKDNELPWHSDPRFSHHVADTSGSAVVAGADSPQSVKELLRNSQTQEQITKSLQEAFATQLENMLRLPTNSINKDAPIIDLGVDSLVAVEIRSWFLKEVGKDMPVLKILGGDSISTLCEEISKEIFEERITLEECAEASDAASTYDKSSSSDADGYTSNPSIFDMPQSTSNVDPHIRADDDINGVFDQISLMSYSQARMWFPFLLLEDKSTYNCTTSYRLRGLLDVQRYEDAIHSVIYKHQTLRTCFYTNPSTGEPTQAVSVTSPFELKKVNSVNDESSVELETGIIAGHIYDLENADVFVATLVTHSPDYHTIIFGYHHIIMDGVSWQQFLQEVEQFYIRPMRRPLLPTVDYIDFAVKQRSELNLPAVQKRRAFWKGMYSQLPQTLPLLPFAKVNSRKPLRGYQARETQIEMDPALVQRIKAVSTDHQGTSFHFYVAALQVMLHRLLGISDICIGITDANRSDPLFMKTIGLLLDSLPLWFHLDENETFRDRFQSTRNVIYSALGNSGIPLDVILDDVGIENSASHMPLFQVLVNYRMGALAQESVGEDIKLDYLAYEDARHPFDFILTIDEKGGRGGLTLSMQNDLYDQAAADMFIATYIHFMESFATLPLTGIVEPDLYPKVLTQDAIQRGVGPRLAPFEPHTLVARVDQMVQEYNSEVAITDSSGSYTYREMSTQINSIVTALEQKGVSEGTRVGLFGKLSANTIFTLLAILRAGAVYVPLDERNSDERLVDIVMESGARVIVHDNETGPRVPNLISTSTADIAVLNSSSVKPSKSAMSGDKSSPAKLGFIMFTSGSTGKPKGIMLSHRNMLAHIDAATTAMDLKRETVLQQSALGYDASIAQIFYALANGGKLVVSSNRGEMGTMAKMMRDERVTLTLMAPSEYTLLMQYGKEDLMLCDSWKIAMCGGEAFPPRLRLGFRELDLAGLHVWNAYGPTEISVASNMGRVDYRNESLDFETSIPIGKALPGYSICLVNESMQAVPAGCPGQIAVRGAAVSRGYLGQEALTNEKFRPAATIPNPLSTDSSTETKATDMWYMTGDVARMTAEGSLVYIGRVEQDSQIKLRGIRIELEEIANSILETAKGILSQAVVGVRGEGQAQFLVGYVVFAAGKAPSDVGQFLNKLLLQLPLPLYMRPAQAVPLEALPMTNSGKLDKKSLLSIPLPSVTTLGENPAELTPTEKQLKQIWESVLERTDVQITRLSNFFSAGGNSLLLLRLQAEIRKAWDINISLPELFRINTLQSLAELLRTPGDMSATGTSGISGGLDHLDWATETDIPNSILQLGRSNVEKQLLNDTARSANRGLVVMVTGATGFLGRQIIAELQARPEIVQIQCIAVRNTSSEAARAIERDCPKAILYSGDLTLPRLGLAEDEARLLFSDVDAIIHNGADVSFLKPYAALREPNLGSTQELVRLSLRMSPDRPIPLHFVSTAGVGILTGQQYVPAASLAEHTPAGKPVDGYVASKWASEVLLEKITKTAATRLPVRIYRPSSITGTGAPALDIMHNVVIFSRKLRAVPKMRGWNGWFDFVSVERTAKGIVDGIFEASNTETEAQNVGPDFVHLSGEHVIPIAEAKSQMERESGYAFRSLELKEWLREAIDVGLHTLVAAYLESTIEVEAAEIWFPKLQSSLTFESTERGAVLKF